jgi:hypothetical protein
MVATAGLNSSDQAVIPNVFHFIFGLQKQRAPFHLCHYLCLESCLRVNRPERVFLYYHYKPFGPYWDLIAPRLTLEKVDLVSRISFRRYGLRNRACWRYRYAHHADFIRLEKLLAHGGVYADMDTIFVNPFPARLFKNDFVLGREIDVVSPSTGRPQPSLCNAVILARPGAAFGKLWLAAMESAFDGSWSNHSTLLPQQLSSLHPELIHIEPQRTFYKHIWTPEGLQTLLQGLDPDFNEVVSMHLWSHLWWSRRRTDFSSFHAGLLTEAYIREVDTTYNIAARKFLPG